MYVLNIIKKRTYNCINNAVTSYYGTITNNCSKIFNYLLIDNKSCEHSFGVIKESYIINNTNGYCTVKDSDFYEIKKLLFFEDLPVEVVPRKDNVLLLMVNTITKLGIFLLILILIIYCYNKLKLQRNIEPITIEEHQLPIVNRDDYYIIEDIPSDQECSICMEPFNTNTIKLSCEHMYHEECIVEWFQRSKRCPLCNNEG